MSARWLTVAEVAEELGVSMRTVHRWISSGDMPAVRLPGGHLRIAESVLVQQIASWAVAPGARNEAAG